MQIFTNPLEKPLSRKQIFSALLFALFLGASVWATGESIARSVALPKFFTYIIGFAAMAAASFCLSMIHKSISDSYVNKRIQLLIIGLIGWLFFWSGSFTSNTHNIYFLMVVDEMRQEELRNIKNELQLIKDKSVAAFDIAKGRYASAIENNIENMKYEIINEGQLGHGPKTDSILAVISNLLGSEVTRLDPRSNSRADLQSHARQMATKIREMKQHKLREIDDRIKNLKKFIEKPQYQYILLQLDTAINNYDHEPMDDIKMILRNSYSHYNQCFDYLQQLFEDEFLKENSRLQLNNLPKTPESVELENIARSWQQFLKGNFDSWHFYLAIIWALIIDLACFILYFFGVLPNEDD